MNPRLRAWLQDIAIALLVAGCVFVLCYFALVQFA